VTVTEDQLAARVPAGAPAAEPPPGASLLVLAEPVRRRLTVAVALGAAGAALGVAGLVALAYALRELFRPEPDGTALVALLVAAAIGAVGRCCAPGSRPTWVGSRSATCCGWAQGH
jgi:hypothetical protein